MTSATELPSSVHIRLYNRDGETYGVGMPVVAIFDKTVADGRSFARATQVTVDGKPIQAAWYFQHSPEALGAMEAHLRPEGYWPAHADVHVTLNTKGLSAGRGRTYDDSLSLDFRTGAQNIVTVDGRTHTLTVTSDGRPMGSYPVSLGAVKTPTFNGTKVIMDKAAKARLKGPGFDQLAPYAQQLTYSGEYLIGAPWNQAGITSKVDTSNGCTNLSLADAARLYRLLRVGDVVRYVNTTGAQMPPSDGFGDWNVPWSDWVGGGLLPTK
jgi:lipoprotein-anchoring transpeptidase ErfK/SrfK